MKSIGDEGFRRIARKLGQSAVDIGDEAVAIDRVVTDEAGTAEIFYFNNGNIGILYPDGNFSQFGESMSDDQGEFLQTVQDTVMTGNYTPEVVEFSNQEQSWVDDMQSGEHTVEQEWGANPQYGMPSGVRY